MHEALDSKHDKLKREIVEGKKATVREMQLHLNFAVPCVTPTDFLSLICPTADQAETAWMMMLGGIQGSFVDVGGHHGNVRHLPPQLQHQYNPAQHQFKLAKACRE
jgi:hypothetical protein